jgi:ribosomal protein S18 acetylase RimI-like enzyme
MTVCNDYEISYRNLEERDIASVAELCSAVFDGGEGWRRAGEHYNKLESVEENREALTQKYHELVVKDSIMSHKEGNPHVMIVAVANDENESICGFLEVGFLPCPIPVAVTWAGGDTSNEVIDVPYLGSVLVHKEYRRRGIGSTLVGMGERVCGDWKEGMLWLTVDSDNLVAIEMYTKMGFKFKSRVDERRSIPSSPSTPLGQAMPKTKITRIYMSKSIAVSA